MSSSPRPMRTLLLRIASGRSRWSAPMERALDSLDYPVRLAQCASAIPGAKLVDAAAESLRPAQVLLLAKGFDLCVLELDGDDYDAALSAARDLKEQYPSLLLAALGPRRREALSARSPFDFICEEDEDAVLLDLALGRPAEDIPGLRRKEGARWLPGSGRRDSMADPGTLISIYRRDLNYARYRLPHLLFPHVTLPGGLGGRSRGAERLLDDCRAVLDAGWPVREIHFEDGSITRDPDKARAIAAGMRALPFAWSCRTCPPRPGARPDLSTGVLSELASSGLRLLVIDFDDESAGKTGAVALLRACRDLGVKVHGRFTLGGRGETRQTVRKRIGRVCRFDLDSIHVDAQIPPEGGLDEEDMHRALYRTYARFYLRPRPIARTLRAVWERPEQRRRRLALGGRFLKYLWRGPEAVQT